MMDEMQGSQAPDPKVIAQAGDVVTSALGALAELNPAFGEVLEHFNQVFGEFTGGGGAENQGGNAAAQPVR